jgi:hypothetical protein
MPWLLTAAADWVFALAGAIIGLVAVRKTALEWAASRSLSVLLHRNGASKEDVEGFLVELHKVPEDGGRRISGVISGSANAVAASINSLSADEKSRIADILVKDSDQARRKFLESKVSEQEGDAG